MLLNNREITISSAGSRKATFWPKQKLLLSELYEKLRLPTRSTETLAEYMALKKGKQDDLKDVGGFVGGELDNGRRKANSVVGRDLVVLDLDNVPPGGTNDILKRLEGLGCGYCAYSTRKHSENAPRLRVLIPLDRTVVVDEYEPISRRAAWYIQNELTFFDKSTFEPSRLMYWPSCSRDSVYIFQFADKPMLSADGVLSTYNDWKSFNEWPQVPGVQQEYQKLAAKQADPTEKHGVIGVFCRTYDVFSAMEKFLPGEYESCDNMPGRYTYTGGSTAGGAIIYEEGKFIYSHHATDPAGGKLCNAFDLIRLHKFGNKDDDVKSDTPANKLPSYVAMCEFAIADNNVAVMMNKERRDKAIEEFEDVTNEDDVNWMSKLSVSSSTGAIAKTTDNILIILENDPHLKGKIATDDFAHKGVAVDTLPWDKKRQGRREWSDNDEAGIRWYLEKVYGITGKEKILDGLSLCGRNHSYDEVKIYLDSLSWDGVLRLDTLFIDYLGADDNEYIRAVTRKAFTSAVARAYVPGTKFDTMTILTGKQGIGKSTILRKMGLNKWFTDGIKTFEGKEVCELIQGMWIVEIGELEALNKSQVGRVKQILSQEIDRFRAAYGRHVQDCPRRCVFFGTSNNAEYLRDKTGNRRFWPVDTGIIEPVKSVFKDLDNEVDQLWAEAKFRYQMGEPLFLSKKLEEMAKEEQEVHREQSVREGLIREFLERKVPLGWHKWDLDKRLMFWSGNIADKCNYELVERDRVCALEIWCELFGGDFKGMGYADAAEINGIINLVKGWERQKKAMRLGYCGVSKGFKKV